MLEEAKKFVKEHKRQIIVGLIIISIMQRQAYNAGFADGLATMPKELTIMFAKNNASGVIEKLLINGKLYIISA